LKPDAPKAVDEVAVLKDPKSFVDLGGGEGVVCATAAGYPSFVVAGIGSVKVFVWTCGGGETLDELVSVVEVGWLFHHGLRTGLSGHSALDLRQVWH
jgi:hypothetical protein